MSKGDAVEQVWNVGTLFIAAVALVVSILSWRASERASERAIRASIYDRRFEVYLDAERFISGWMREARPDMSLLGPLIGAWTRSHFLFEKEVTQYLRKLWLDAVDANYQSKVAAGEAPGDHGEAINKVHELLMAHADHEQLRGKFMSDLRI